MTNKHDERVEEIVEEFIKSYEGILPPESIEAGADWYRQTLTTLTKEVREQTLAEVRESQVIEELTWLANPGAETLSDGTRITEFCHKVRELLDTLDNK